MFRDVFVPINELKNVLLVVEMNVHSDLGKGYPVTLTDRSIELPRVA